MPGLGHLAGCNWCDWQSAEVYGDSPKAIEASREHALAEHPKEAR